MMASDQMARHVLVTRRIEEVSGIRPVTLLIASGIALITAILILTGIAANHLRQQALSAAERELARVGSVLAAASNRSLDAIDAQLAGIAGGLSQNANTDSQRFREAASAPETNALLQSRLGRPARLVGLALIGSNGELLNHAGAWHPGISAGNSAGDSADAGSDMAARLRAMPARASLIGVAIRDPKTGALSLPFAHRVDSPSGIPLGAVVGMVPATYFTSLFASVPLAPDAVIVLLGPEGAILARHPAQPGKAQTAVKDTDLAAVFRDASETFVRHASAPEGGWQIEALRALADYPAAVAVSRSADQILAEWSHQILWFGGFAVIGAFAIGVMIYLIARQFQTHDTIAEMRAERIEGEKIEIERARLAVEAELLKSERLSVLGQLTATVAHELRNPLSAIRNTLFAVKELTTNAGVKLDRPIARMERSIERCDRIISDLLEYTRNRELNRTSVRFDRWLADMLAEQSVPPAVVLAPELGAADAIVPVDADRVRRVVINLVENAAQALAETAPDREKRISVRTSTQDGELVLVVEDTGPGIAPENLSRIFEPLFSTKSFGTGLGLPTVKQIVTQHGGIITVESELGRGTCVTVRLPLQPDAMAEAMAEAMEEVKVAA